MRETCKKLGQNLKGNCSVEVEIKKNQLIATITINGEAKVTSSKHIEAHHLEESLFLILSYL